MAWLAVDPDGKEYIHEHKPNRGNCCWDPLYYAESGMILLPKGTIEKLIGKSITWENEAVEIN